MKRIDELFTKEIKRAAIAGHVHPDGDCIGSVSALFNYLRKNFPEVEVKMFLERVPEAFGFLPGIGGALTSAEGEGGFDLFISLDTSNVERIAVAGNIFENAAHTACIDHHVTNEGYADVNVIEPEASSASEVLYTLLDPEKVDLDTAICIYTGIIHDSGVFRYSCVGPRTMAIAGELLAKGVPSAKIIEESFDTKSFTATRLLGHALDKARLALSGRAAVSVLTAEDFSAYGAGKGDTDGIPENLRKIKGADAAIFLYETGDGEFKVSMRTTEKVDAAEAMKLFGGGGHARAAGCTICADPEEAAAKVLEAVAAQLRQQ